VISEDWTLRTAVRAELREAGIEALGFPSPDEAADAASAGLPDVTVLDLSCASIAHPGLAPLVQRTGLVLVAPGIEPPPEVPKGALVLRRPVSVLEIVAAVRQMFAGLCA